MVVFLRDPSSLLCLHYSLAAIISLMVLHIVCILLACKCSPLTCALNSRLFSTYLPWPKSDSHFPPQNLSFQSFHHLKGHLHLADVQLPVSEPLYLHSCPHSPCLAHQPLPLPNVFKLLRAPHASGTVLEAADTGENKAAKSPGLAF